MDPAVAAKLDTESHQALAVWRIQVGYAQSGEYPQLDPAEVEARKRTVIVTYQGDVEALRLACLATGFDSGGRISGLIALWDLERLVAVPEVIRIVMEPILEVR